MGELLTKSILIITVAALIILISILFFPLLGSFGTILLFELPVCEISSTDYKLPVFLFDLQYSLLVLSPLFLLSSHLFLSLVLPQLLVSESLLLNLFALVLILEVLLQLLL